MTAKGNINLRVPPQLHEAIKAAAAEQGVSLNRWITTVLAGAVSFSPVHHEHRGGARVNEPAPRPKERALHERDEGSQAD